MLADLIARQRGPAGDRLVSAAPRAATPVRGLLLLAAMVVIGLPPFSGFIGKLVALKAFSGEPHQTLAWIAILLSSLVVLVMLARAGTQLVWHTGQASREATWRHLPKFWPLVFCWPCRVSCRLKRSGC